MGRMFKNKLVIAFFVGLIAFFFLVFYFVYSRSNRSSEDFWSVTAKALDYQSYSEGKWDIGIDSTTKDHPQLAIRNIEGDDFVCYGFDSDGITYIFTTKKVEDDQTINNEQIHIESMKSGYKKYSVEYMNVIYHGNLYFDTISASGTITIQEDGQIVFDEVPLLREAMEKERDLIADFEEKFDVDYSKTDFINLPELFRGVQFHEDTNYDESLNTISYFSEADINAKGYSIQTFLELDKDGNTGVYGSYVAEQKMYGSQIDVTLEPRSVENCYDLIPLYDYEVDLTAYISGNVIYLYPIDTTDEILMQEIQNNCPNSLNQLSADIKPIEMW